MHTRNTQTNNNNNDEDGDDCRTDNVHIPISIDIKKTASSGISVALR